MSSFKTYVDITEHGTEDYEWVISEDDQPKLEPRLLPGEVIVASAPNVLKFANISNRKHGTSGWLFVTNFKVAFVSPTSSSSTKDERNKLVSPNEICLANIDHIYQVNGDRRKRLLPGSPIVSNIKTLQIVCKDFSMHSYSFKFCPVGFHKTVANAILHHSYPKRVELLFTFECTLPATQEVHGMQFFTSSTDWESEVERCHCQDGWRVCVANERYQLSASLPRWFVVPRSLTDNQILKASKHFMGNRPPVWSWGHINKCVMVRMAVLHPFIADTQQESIMLEHVRKSHPSVREPLILELDKSMPSPNEIRASWNRLRDSCCSPLDNIQKFWEQDGRFMSLLNGSRWPHHVMLCLRMANRVVEAISVHQVSVVLQESESRDTSAIISSLAQLMMDPHYRTINGFQSLVQKEWITLGHAFTKRLGRVVTAAELAAAVESNSPSSTGGVSQQSPMFQLFLDSVWQLQHQFPAAFEFSQTYLTTLWDSLHNSVFDTFAFDSDRVRHLFSTLGTDQPVNVGKTEESAQQQHAQLISRSVWDWSAQLHDVDIGLFLNPLFSVTCRVAAYRQRRGIPPTPSRPLVASPARWIPSSPNKSAAAGGDRPRRNSISGTLTRGNTIGAEYGAAGSDATGGTDTLGRSWGSRFGLSGLTDSMLGSSSSGGSSRWKRIRSTLFHGHSGRSFSPGVIDEGPEGPDGLDIPVAYRASLHRVSSNDQRWTTVFAADQPAVYDPIPSFSVRLQPTARPLKLDLDWGVPLNPDEPPIPYHQLDWPVYSTLPVSDSLVDFRIWSQCYLRWIPVLDIRGGGQPAIYFHHSSLVNDILELEGQLEQLEEQRLRGVALQQNGGDSAGQRFVTMSDHSIGLDGHHQVTLSSFHPFVQQQNDSALSFGEWEIVPSPVMTGSGATLSRRAVAASAGSNNHADSSAEAAP